MKFDINTPDATAALFGTGNRTSQTNLDILETLNEIKIGESFTVATPKDTKGDNQNAKGINFATSVDSHLSMKLKDKDYSKSIKPDPKGEKIHIKKTVKQIRKPKS
jgi:hypothetical protein